MMLVIVISIVVSLALIAGAAWGIYGNLGRRTEGFILALAGGALLLSLVTELIQPAMEQANLGLVGLAVSAGAGVFTLIDWLIEARAKNAGGGGLLAAITLDGIPENLALGVALIGAGPLTVAALAGSIFLSNLPEAAGGARQMRDDGHAKRSVLALWSMTAVILALAAIAGNILFAGLPGHWLAMMQCFAAGAVVASLATEVFPKAFSEDHQLAGIATALGLLMALALGSLAE